MIMQTTQSTLLQMEDNIEHYDPEQWYGIITLEDLRNDYESYKEVANTLTRREMRLIALLRGCRIVDRQRFLKCAEQLHVALRACDTLGEITHPTE